MYARVVGVDVVIGKRLLPLLRRSNSLTLEYASFLVVCRWISSGIVGFVHDWTRRTIGT